MGIIDQKTKIMANVSALNVLTEGLPNFKKTNSLSSINNKTNATDFLIDLVKILIGYEELKDNVIDILTRKLPEIEIELKQSLKQQLKEYVNCGVNPSIPAWLRSTGSGITLKLNDIDFFDVTKIDPTSTLGYLAYSDNYGGASSTDFNTFLYSNIDLNKSVTIANGGSTTSWGSSTIGSDILDVTFNPIGTTENNVVKFNANQNYDNKSLTDFNNDFINSISFFGSPGDFKGRILLNTIVDNMFGTTSKQIGKSKKQIKKEAEINECLQCILNSDENDVIDDSYFEFSNEQLIKIEQFTNNRKNGVSMLDTCGNQPVSIPINTLFDINNEFTAITTNITGTTSQEQSQVNAMDKAIDTLANAQTENVNTIDVPTVKVNFVLELINEFMKAIINLIISPKLISLYSINYQILYGQGSTYTGPIDFMKQNKNLIIGISKTVLELVIKMLINLTLKYISKKISKKMTDDEIEKGKNYISQILSLIGVPPMVIRQIQSLGYVGG